MRELIWMEMPSLPSAITAGWPTLIVSGREPPAEPTLNSRVPVTVMAPGVGVPVLTTVALIVVAGGTGAEVDDAAGAAGTGAMGETVTRGTTDTEPRIFAIKSATL